MTYSSSPPDFTHFSYAIALPPANAKVSAWAKLKEAERRIAMYQWTETENDPGAAQHRILLNDAVSAFLLSFESTIQFLKDQWHKAGLRDFDQWLKSQPSHDLTVRAIRTLRHFEAHVEPKPIPRNIKVTIGVVAGPSDNDIQVESCTWHLPRLSSADLQLLQRPVLDAVDIQPWQQLASSTNAAAQFEHALRQLAAILLAAESRL